MNQKTNENLLEAQRYAKLSLAARQGSKNTPIELHEAYVKLSHAAQLGSKGAAMELQVLKFNSGFKVGQLVVFFKTVEEGVFKGVIKSEASVIDGKAVVELEGIGDVPLSWISHIAD